MFTVRNGISASGHVFLVLLNEIIFYWSDCNRKGAGPANDRIVTPAVTSIARETPNYSEVGKNSSASRHIQGPVSGITKVPPYGDNEEREAGPFIMMKTENTLRERNCGGKEEEEELNNLDKLPGK